MSTQRQLEVQLLSAARQSREALDLVHKKLGDYRFSDTAYHWLWEKITAHRTKGELARLESLEGQIRAETPDAHEPLIEALLEIWKAPPTTTPQTDCETLKHYHRHDQMTKGLDRAVKALNRGDLDAVSEAMVQTSIDSNKDGLEVVSLIDFDDWDSTSELTKGIPTGIMTYDEVTMGGSTRGDLGVLFGVTNMGKSILATNFGYAAFKHNWNVLHIDTENGMDETRARYMARAQRLPTRALNRKRFGYSTEFREWAERHKERINKHLRLVSIGVDQTSMEEVHAMISELCHTGWEPDEIIFDSPDHCVATGKVDNMGYLAKQRYEKLKGWGQEFNASIWAVTQAKQEAEGKIVTNKNVGWGYDKARIADAVITINPGLDDRGTPLSEKNMGNKRCLFVAKARKSGGRFIIPLLTDFATAYIAEQLPGYQPEDIDAED